jgi:hypothetical protein
LLSVLLLLSQAVVPAGAQQGSGNYFTLNSLTLADGTSIDEVIINGPPEPPPGFEVERQAVSLPEPDSAAGINVLTEVPAFNWVFGCSAVSGAMIAGYYDRLGWPNIYTGPTNGGVMPLNNSSWPTWSDGYRTYPNCPLIASKNGLDGRTTRGSIDDYWVRYESSSPDPYILGGWTQHSWGSAIGDYMKTSQSAYNNIDGSTTFYNYTSSPNRLTCATMASQNYHDGTLGRKQFYEARGYTVTDCYNQKTDNTIYGGFSFAQFKAEIDAGRPVMLNLEGHTIVGVGYDDSQNLVYLHDTWDYSNHTMTWGTSYSGMPLLSVSIVNLSRPSLPDLVVSSVTSPTSGVAGGTINVAMTVTNQGAQAAGSFWAAFYLSPDSTITTGDINTGWGCPIPSLAAGASINCGGEIGIPASVSSGTYYLGGYADSANAINESSEINNGRAASNRIAITGSGPGRTPVYRFFNNNAGGHFFTISEAEKNTVIANYPWFRYEGVGFYAYPAQIAGAWPIYRFFNNNAGGHFFTISEAEKDTVIASYNWFRYEGVGFYAYPTPVAGAWPVYRFFNNNAGGHFFTISEAEKDTVIANYKWFRYEGVGFYAYPTAN